MFDITSVTADAANTIVRVGWTYTIAEGSLGGTHNLSMPAGNKPLSSVSKADLIDWLKDQIRNTEEELQEGIKEQAEAKTMASTERQVPVPK